MNPRLAADRFFDSPLAILPTAAQWLADTVRVWTPDAGYEAAATGKKRRPSRAGPWGC